MKNIKNLFISLFLPLFRLFFQKKTFSSFQSGLKEEEKHREHLSKVLKEVYNIKLVITLITFFINFFFHPNIKSERESEKFKKNLFLTKLKLKGEKIALK